jgi:hypothetical protein
MARAAIVFSAIVVIIFLTVVILIYRSHKNSTGAMVGDLNRKQEQEMRQLLGEAAHVMRGIGPGIHLDESDVLSDRSRRAVNNWLVRYEDKVESYGGGS